MNTPSALIAGAYLVANLACMAAYLPQIIRVVRSAEARRQAVGAMWWVWTVGGLTEWMYASSTSESGLWQAMAALHTGASGVIAIITTHEQVRHWWHGRQEKSLPPPLQSMGS